MIVQPQGQAHLSAQSVRVAIHWQLDSTKRHYCNHILFYAVSIFFVILSSRHHHHNIIILRLCWYTTPATVLQVFDSKLKTYLMKIFQGKKADLSNGYTCTASMDNTSTLSYWRRYSVLALVLLALSSPVNYGHAFVAPYQPILNGGTCKTTTRQMANIQQFNNCRDTLL